MGNKDYRKEEKSAEIGKLKKHIRHQDKEIARLKSELRTIERAFSKNIVFLKERSNELTVEELIRGADEELSLKEIKDDKKDRFAELQRKWACHKCNEGILRLIIVPGLEYNRYFRKCSICSNRTKVKEHTNEIEGIQ